MMATTTANSSPSATPLTDAGTPPAPTLDLPLPTITLSSLDLDAHDHDDAPAGGFMTAELQFLQQHLGYSSAELAMLSAASGASESDLGAPAPAPAAHADMVPPVVDKVPADKEAADHVDGAPVMPPVPSDEPVLPGATDLSRSLSTMSLARKTDDALAMIQVLDAGAILGADARPPEIPKTKIKKTSRRTLVAAMLGAAADKATGKSKDKKSKKDKDKDGKEAKESSSSSSSKKDKKEKKEKKEKRDKDRRRSSSRPRDRESSTATTDSGFLPPALPSDLPSLHVEHLDSSELAKLAHDTFDLSDNEAADAFGATLDVAADIAHVPIPLAVPPRAVTALQLSDPYINTYTKASRAARASGADLTVHVDHEDGVVVVTCPIARPRARMAAFLAMALDALKAQQMQMDAEDDVPLRRPSVVPTPRPQSLLVIPPTARPRSVAAPAAATPRARPLSMMPPNAAANAHRASVFLRQSSGSLDTVGSGSTPTVEDDDHVPLAAVAGKSSLDGGVANDCDDHLPLHRIAGALPSPATSRRARMSMMLPNGAGMAIPAGPASPMLGVPSQPAHRRPRSMVVADPPLARPGSMLIASPDMPLTRPARGTPRPVSMFIAPSTTAPPPYAGASPLEQYLHQQAQLPMTSPRMPTGAGRSDSAKGSSVDGFPVGSGEDSDDEVVGISQMRRMSAPRVANAHRSGMRPSSMYVPGMVAATGVGGVVPRRW
ncbi:hypothetical protein GGF31_006696 [Allomyces arbusculus]|nr:hypothetical protein GGF31_006696 [Allomyces arbusculus]